MLNIKTQAAASNGKGAVLIGELGGYPALVRYAPKDIGRPERMAEFEELAAKAAAKLGWKRDMRARKGWRKISK